MTYGSNQVPLGAPAEQPTLQGWQTTLCLLADSLAALSNEIDQLANRVYGATPQGVQKSPSDIPQHSAISAIDAQIERLRLNVVEAEANFRRFRDLA